MNGIVFKLNGKEVTRPATITLIHNGVVVQYNRPLAHGTGAKTRAPLVEKGPILVQNHTDEVRFRSFWIRHLKPRTDTEFNDAKVDKNKRAKHGAEQDRQDHYESDFHPYPLAITLLGFAGAR